MDCQVSHNPPTGQTPLRLGVVSYLNAKPLICGLERDPAVRLCFDVPSRLTLRLLRGDFEAALIPTIDLLNCERRLDIISDACIACDGETLTVRVFSKVPPDQIQRIYVDPDSRTSIVLAKLIWPALYGNDVAFVDLDSAANFDHHESILLIGDKVVAMQLDEFRYQVDLGSAWKTWTGLPFVFAVWAADAGPNTVALGRFLSTVRDAGIRQVGQLAVEFGPAHGWTPALAQQYLQHNLRFGLSDKHVEGMVRFLDLASERGFAAQRKELQAI